MFEPVQLEATLKPYLEKLEAERLIVAAKISARTKGVLGISLLLLVTMITIAFIKWKEGMPEIFLIALLVVGFIVLVIIGGISYALLTKGLRKRYNQTIKAKIYEKALQCYNSSITYSPQQYITEATFERANLFTGFNRYGGEDLCAGVTADNRSFQFSELKVYHKQHSSNRNGNSNKVRTIFEGVFYEVKLPVTFPARVKILPDHAEQNFGAVGKFMQGMLNKAMSTVAMRDPLVRFDEEYPAFERAFRIYSNSEAAARTLISADFVEKIKAFQSYLGTGMYLSFEEDSCYFGIKQGQFLAVDVNRSLLSTVFIDQLEENLDRCFGLLKHLETLTTLGTTTNNSNPFEADASKKEIDIPPSSNPLSKKDSSNSYKKSDSRDNPFLL